MNANFFNLQRMKQLQETTPVLFVRLGSLSFNYYTDIEGNDHQVPSAI